MLQYACIPSAICKCACVHATGKIASKVFSNNNIAIAKKEAGCPLVRFCATLKVLSKIDDVSVIDKFRRWHCFQQLTTHAV